MIGRLVNLPFKVLGSVARAVQEREAARDQADDRASVAKVDPETIALDVPPDFDPGPIRTTAKRAVTGSRWLLDIGTQEEWQTEHAADAVHIPAPEIGIRLAELPPDTRIVVYGRQSADSETVVRFLRFRGLDDTWSLHGGLTAWTRAGGATTRGADR